MTKINLTETSPQTRLVAWISLLLLTACLLLFPVNLAYQYRAIQAPYIFENLPLFSAMFCVWVLLWFFLLFSRKDTGRQLDWQNLVLVCVFGAVFIGFWSTVSPYSCYADDMYNMGHVRWLNENGSIPIGAENLVYFDHPGMHILVSAISQCTGLDIFDSRLLFKVLNTALFSALYYIYAVRILKSNRLACFSFLVVGVGSIVLVDKMRIFSAGSLGYTMLAGFLLLLTSSEVKVFGTTLAERVVLLLLFSAMVISYLPATLLVVFIMFFMLAVGLVGRTKQPQPSLTTICLFLVMMLAWELYWTWHTFPGLVSFLPQIKEDLFSGQFLEGLLVMGSANVGEAVPFWANITRLIWWALLGIATVLCFLGLLRIRRQEADERLIIGGLLAVTLMAGLGLVASWSGYQFKRFLLYAPLFCMPYLLLFLLRFRSYGKILLTSLAALTLVLALPTFLCSINSVATDATQNYECAAGEFLDSRGTTGGGNYYVHCTFVYTAPWIYYYVPSARQDGVAERDFYARGGNEVLWQSLDGVLDSYTRPASWITQQRLFVWGEKSKEPFEHLRGIPADDPHWDVVTQVLSETDRIYDNGHLQIFTVPT